MNIIFLFLSMFFCHIVDDFYLQGILASMKQKAWWKGNAPQKLYKFDYIIALIIHALSWSFMIMLPVSVYYHFQITTKFLIVYIINVVIHAIVDDLKANKHLINLVIDQSIHFGQVAITGIILF